VTRLAVQLGRRPKPYRKITPDGTVSTFAGSSQPGFSEGTGVGARFSSPADITIDSAGQPSHPHD